MKDKVFSKVSLLSAYATNRYSSMTRKLTRSWTLKNHCFNAQGDPKIGKFLYAFNFIKYWPIFKLFSQSESGKFLY